MGRSSIVTRVFPLKLYKEIIIKSLSWFGMCIFRLIMGLVSLLVMCIGAVALFIWGFYTGTRSPIVMLSHQEVKSWPKLILDSAGTIFTLRVTGTVDVYNPFPVSASISSASGDIYMFLEKFDPTKYQSVESNNSEGSALTGAVNDVVKFFQGQDMSDYNLIKLNKFEVPNIKERLTNFQQLEFAAPVSFILPALSVQDDEGSMEDLILRNCKKHGYLNFKLRFNALYFSYIGIKIKSPTAMTEFYSVPCPEKLFHKANYSEVEVEDTERGNRPNSMSGQTDRTVVRRNFEQGRDRNLQPSPKDFV